MAYTFGGATTDDIVWASATTLGASSRASLVCGWWYPTTLTATRKLWSGHTVGIFGAEIDSTTDELRFRTDNATTDGQWTTTGVGLVVDEWKFLAILSTTFNTSTAAAWRVWAGSIAEAPTEKTVTVATSPSGNFTGGANFYLGNASTGSLAFQGDIGSGFLFSTSAAASASLHPFSLAALGQVSNTEAEFVYQRFVLPAWEGEVWNNDGCKRMSTLGGQSDAFYTWNFDATLPQVLAHQTNNATAFSGITPTINGATPSQNRTPRPHIYQGNHPIPVFGV